MKIFKVLALALSILVASNAYSETLRVGTECTYYPFNFRDSAGELQGYDVDVARGIAKRLNMDIEFVCQKWDGLLPSLIANKYDLLIASLSITDERKERIDFSIPYRISVGQFSAAKAKNLQLFNDDGSVNHEGFKGVRVGLQRSSVHDNWIKANVPEADLVYYDTMDGLFLDLRNGRIDAVMSNPMKAYLSFLSTDEGSNFTIVGPQITDQTYFGPGVGVGIQKGNDELREKVNKAIQEEIDSGALETYARKYFPFAIHPEANQLEEMRK